MSKTNMKIEYLVIHNYDLNHICFLVRNDRTVNHYKILKTSEECFFIAWGLNFKTLQSLIQYYSKDAKCTDFILHKPAIQV